MDLGFASRRAGVLLTARWPCSVAVAAIARRIAVEHLCVLDNALGDEQGEGDAGVGRSRG